MVNQPQPHRLKWSSLTGGTAALVAWGCNTVIFWDNNSDWVVFKVASVLAAFLTGFGLWYLLLTRRPRPTIKAGVVTGGLIGLLAHPLAWYLSILIGYFSGQTDSLGQSTANPLEGIPMALFYGLIGCLFYGWLTALLGALAGGVIAYFQTKRAAQ
jgi:hypothetical protein